MGNNALCSMLLAHNANIESRTKSTCTPLGFAARGGQLDTVALLLSSQANVNSNRGDTTPLIEAVIYGSSQTCSALIEAKALVNAQTSYNHGTAFYSAVRSCRPEAARVLLSARADVNAKPSHSICRPIEIAAEGGFDTLCIAMLDEQTIPGKYIRKAVKRAAKYRKTETVRAIVAWQNQAAIAFTNLARVGGAGQQQQPQHWNFTHSARAL
jgi:ankyrin repeat protein